MKRQEIQKRLKDIIANTQNTINVLESKQDWFGELKVKVHDLNRHVALQGKDLFDKSEVMQQVLEQFFEQELECF